MCLFFFLIDGTIDRKEVVIVTSRMEFWNIARSHNGVWPGDGARLGGRICMYARTHVAFHVTSRYNDSPPRKSKREVYMYVYQGLGAKHMPNLRVFRAKLEFMIKLNSCAYVVVVVVEVKVVEEVV